jgi:hypothetical protein
MTIIFWAAPASAQLFRLGAWGGSLESLTDFSHLETKTGGAQPVQTRFENLRMEERLTLRNEGAYVIDPRLLTLSLGGSFGLSREWVETDDQRHSREGTLQSYDLFAGLFPEAATSLNLFANRNEFFQSRELAGRTKVQNESRGGTLFLRRLYVPSSLTFRQELRKEETSIEDAPPARRDERRNILTYEGQRGWLDSEMDLRYEFVDLTDEVFPDLSFRSHEGGLNYSLDFGPELNRRWDSRLRAFTRTGLTDLTIYTVDELLGIDHTESLRTEYRYFLIHTDTPGGSTTTHTGAFTLRHQLYENLRTTARLDANIQMLPGGERDTYRSRLDLLYTKRLPWDGRLNAGGGAGFEYEDDRFEATETFVPQERHTVSTPFAFPVALDNPFVDSSSVVVTKVTVGPLPVGCFSPPGPPTPLVVGRDYTLRTIGDITEIVPIPCAGAVPGLNPGDEIAVDYRFSVSSSLRFTTLSRHGSLSLDYRWIRPYISHERVEQNLLSGQNGQFLNTRESNTGGVELRYDGRRLRSSILGEARRFTSQRQSFDSIRSAQFVGITLRPELALNLNGEEALFEFKNPDHRTRTITARATLTYALGVSLFAELLGGYRFLRDTLVPIERITEVSLRVRWLFRKLEVDPTIEFFDRQRGDTETREFRGTLRIIRRF